LNVRQVQTIKTPGRHADGGGLYLVVTKAGAKRWAFLYRRRRDGKLSEMGLGGVTSVSLAMARHQAAEARALLAAGKDPIKERQNNQNAARRVPTFGEFSDRLIDTLEGAFRSRKTAASWRLTIEVYAQPIRERFVDDISTQDVLEILRPIWLSKAETASRVRARIEKSLDAAKAQGFRTGDNPARWRGHLDHLLPKQPSLQRGHHPRHALGRGAGLSRATARDREHRNAGAGIPHPDRSPFGRDPPLGAGWRDHGGPLGRFDLDAKVWTVPANRMKAGREHRVPLSERAVEIVRTLAKAKRGPFVFPG
jgi:hypothetical protein